MLDDIIVWWLDAETFDVMPNTSNTVRVRSAVGGEDVTADRAIIAVQGPNARAYLSRLSSEAAEVSRFRVARFSWNGVSCVVAGTGYTGEDGVECSVPAEAAPAFWESLLALGLHPAGLRSARHPSTRGGPPSARPRAGAWYHTSPGRTRMGGGMGQAGRIQGPGGLGA